MLGAAVLAAIHRRVGARHYVLNAHLSAVIEFWHPVIHKYVWLKILIGAAPIPEEFCGVLRN
jgi:hypothetical protein